MSAKLLHALTDDNPDLQKQIGCMTGIFQLFDRHHFISGRRLYGQQHKGLPSDHPHLSNSKVGAEETASAPRTEKNQFHNQRANIDSSVASQSSSSCSSSFSSAEFNRTALSEPPFLDRSLRNAQKPRISPIDNRPNTFSPWIEQANFVSHTGRQSLDFREIVKDSMYRETQGLSVKTRTKEEKVNRLIKPRDSPRPLQVSKLVDETPVKSISVKPKIPVDLNESLRVLARLKEGPWYFSESRDPPRASYEVKDASWYSITKEGPRFSYDGKEIPRASCDSRDNYKSMAKLKELPRLSLDERECSSRSSKFDIKSGSILQDLQNHNNRKVGENTQPSSIVAKLMGLEPMPNLSSPRKPISEGQRIINTEKKNNHSPASAQVTEETRLDRVLCSPRSNLRDPAAPQARHPDVVKKSASNSRIPIEMAPWRQPECGLGSPKKVFKTHDLPTKLQASEFVYSEIEKRLKELKLQHSEKDLRALLDVMQAKVRLDTKKDQLDKLQQFAAPKIHSNRVSSMESGNKLVPQLNHPISLPTKGSCSPRAYESPIVIMRPAKSIDKSSTTPSSVGPFNSLSFPQGNMLAGDVKSLKHVNGSKGSGQAKDLASKTGSMETINRIQGCANKKVNGRSEENLQRPQKPQPRLTQMSAKPPQVIRDNSSSSTKSSGSLSPRLQQKKQEEERKTRQTNSSHDFSKPRKQPTQPPSDIRHKGNKRISDLSRLSMPIEDQISDISSDTGRHSNHQGDEVSVRSDSNISSASHFDVEITSADRSSDIDSIFPKTSAVYNVNEKNKGTSSNLNDERGSLELGGAGPDQPSPVSVLDQSFYKDDLPSPVKTAYSFKDGNQNAEDVPGEEIWKSCANGHLSSTRRSLDFSQTKGRGNKLANVEHLVQKLQRLNSSHDEAATDYIASLCEKTTPEHRYVSEILLASGFLLKNLSSDTTTPIQRHSSGFLINPDLFLVLEQTKASRLHKHESRKPGLPTQQKTNHDKLHRRLLFDTVNEILISKLPVIDSGPWPGVRMLAKKVVTGQRLLHDICAEIDYLTGENSVNFDDNCLTHRLENWSEQRKDISAIVLDIERMIFKDLVDEIVNGDGWASRLGKQTRCHQPGVKLASLH